MIGSAHAQGGGTLEWLKTRLVIIGAGLAAMTAALTAQEKINDIVLLDKGKIFASGSTFRNRNNCWGITYAVDDQEKELLLAAIRQISRGTNSPSLSRILVEESYDAFRQLRHWGAAFHRDPQGSIKRLHPCFCPHPLAAVITSTGQVHRSLAKRLARPGIRLLQKTAATALLLDGDHIAGLIARSGKHEIKISCQAIILACGGGAATFPHHIVEPGLTGDGYQLLHDLGIPLHNMEYRQSVWEDVSPALPRFQLGYFADGKHRFIDANNHEIPIPPPTSPLTRSRLTHVPISNLQVDREFDAPLLAASATSPIKVVRKASGMLVNHILPHVQACNGGVLISEHGETGVGGLFAAGEITTGMHGGDRIGGMMITNCLVYGRRAAAAALRYLS
ncbi:MAG: FAD-dependent oxidoreductase [Chloroflexota bacterium]